MTKEKPGTRPEVYVDSPGIEQMKSEFIEVVAQLNEDYESGKLSNYNPWTTQYKIEILTIDEAIQFLLFHEGFHMAYVMALKRAISINS